MAKRRFINNQPNINDTSHYSFNDDETNFNYLNSTGLPKNNDKFTKKDLYTNFKGDPLNEKILERNLKTQGASFIRIDKLRIVNAGVSYDVRGIDIRGYMFTKERENPENLSYDQLDDVIPGGSRFFKFTRGNVGEGGDIGNLTFLEGENIISNIGVGQSVQRGDFTNSDSNFAISTNFPLRDTTINTTIIDENVPNEIYIVIWMKGDADRAWGADRRKRRYQVFKIDNLSLFDGSQGKTTTISNISPVLDRTGAGGSGAAESAAWRVKDLSVTISTEPGGTNNFSDVSDYAAAISGTLAPLTYYPYETIPDTFLKINTVRQIDTTLNDGTDLTQDMFRDYAPLSYIGTADIGGNLASNFVDLQGYYEDNDLLSLQASAPATITIDLSMVDSTSNPDTYSFINLEDGRKYLRENYTDDDYVKMVYYTGYITGQFPTYTPTTDENWDLSSWLPNSNLPADDPIQQNSCLPYFIDFINNEGLFSQGIPLNRNIVTEFMFDYYVQYIISSMLVEGLGQIDAVDPELLPLERSYIPVQGEYFYFVVDWNDKKNEIKTLQDWEETRPTTAVQLLDLIEQNLYKLKRLEHQVIEFGDNVASTKILYNEPLINTYNTPGMKNVKIVAFSTDGYSGGAQSSRTIGRWKLITCRFYLDIPINQYPDFSQLGGDEYTTIPWPNITPIIGGVNEQSKYKTSVQQALSSGNISATDIIDERFLVNDLENDEMGQSINLMDLEQVRYFNASYGINELLQIPFTTYTPDQSDEFLSTLPFPEFQEEFDISGEFDDILGEVNMSDYQSWAIVGRPDINQYIFPLIQNGTIDSIPRASEAGVTPRPVVDFYNPTFANPYYPNRYNNFNFWNASTPNTTFSRESSVGQIFINDNLDLNLKQSCQLELNTGNLTGKSIYDSSGKGNQGFLMGDYRVKKNKKDNPMIRDSFIKVPKKANNKNGAL